MIFQGDRQEIYDYLQAVDEIQRSMESTTVSNDEEQLNKVNTTMQIAMSRLEDEFRSILSLHATPFENESIFSSQFSSRRSSSFSEFHDRDDHIGRGLDLYFHTIGNSSLDLGESSTAIESYMSMSSTHEIDLIPPNSIHDLRCISERMITAGYFNKCVQVYGSVRKPAFGANFKKLGVEKLSIGNIQRLEWEALNAKIRKWIPAVKVCVRVLFANEKRLCQLIFKDLGTDADDACFLETVKAPAIQLFNFAEEISIRRMLPENLFQVLDLPDALLDLLPDINAVFDSESSESMRVQVTEILSRLAEAARGMLSEFEKNVLTESSKNPDPRGAIHTITRHVMNDINMISDYKKTLSQLIVSRPPTDSDDLTSQDMDFTEHEDKSPLALHLIWIISILQSNLEGKSKSYKDNSLAYLFIMNNIHYIVQNIKGSPKLKEMIGDDYLKKLIGKRRQAEIGYQRATWAGVLYCLRDEGLHITGSFSSGVSKSVLRERVKSFNAMFEEVHTMQALWLIPDTQLREELRISISEKLIPAYRSFLNRFRLQGQRPENYVKYSAEDLETAILDFFKGTAVSQHSRRRS